MPRRRPPRDTPPDDLKAAIAALARAREARRARAERAARQLPRYTGADDEPTPVIILEHGGTVHVTTPQRPPDAAPVAVGKAVAGVVRAASAGPYALGALVVLAAALWAWLVYR